MAYRIIHELRPEIQHQAFGVFVLIKRVITALVLLPLLIGAIAWLPSHWLYMVFSAAGLIVAWEWAGLMRLPPLETTGRLAFVVVCAAALAAAWLARDYAIWVCILSALWWCISIVLVRGYPENFERRGRPSVFWMATIGVLLIVPTMLGLWQLHAMEEGSWRVFFLFFLVFAADTGAYLAGRNLGRRKLAPNVSPGKTIEGALGGLMLCAAWAACAGPYVFRLESIGAIVQIVCLSVVVAAFTVQGDLVESLFKRSAGVKDSGTILPGHGGLLDRVDSILAGAPLMALGLSVLEI